MMTGNRLIALCLQVDKVFGPCASAGLSPVPIRHDINHLALSSTLSDRAASAWIPLQLSEETLIMDTLGTILPQLTGSSQSSHRIEALERLRFLAQSGACGLVTGATGTGKSRLLSELSGQLRREGLAVAQINFAAVTGTELPWLISSRLGSGLASHVEPMQCWSWLQEYAEACRSSHRHLAFLIDHIELSDETTIAPLCRMIDAFGNSCAWIFAGGEHLTPAWTAFMNQRSWLKITLKDLQRQETMQVLSRNLSEREHLVRFTPEGIDAAHEISQGRMRRLQHLAELAALAAEADEIPQIDADLIRELARELV